MNPHSTLETPVVFARTTRPVPRRSIPDLLEPLEILAANSPNLISNHAAHFTVNGEPYALPRYLYLGAKGGDDPIRLGLFATLHGDEVEGVQALAGFLSLLEKNSEIALGYRLYLYPLCNPTGYEDGSRASRRGHDLNREFWNHSQEPEVLLLQSELVSHAFHGILSLHADSSSPGLYGFVNGTTLSRHLLKPALAAAAAVLPRNENRLIDGFSAREGIIREGYQGILRAPPRIKPRPFEIVLETPQAAPAALQAQALVKALETIVVEYRKFISYAANL